MPNARMNSIKDPELYEELRQDGFAFDVERLARAKRGVLKTGW